MAAKKDTEQTVLIPILSRKESNPGFLDKATHGFERVIFLAVIDRGEMVGQFGFVASEIRTATQLTETLKTLVEQQGKTAEDIVEWGDTGHKISRIAEMKNCSKIAVMEQHNQYFRKLLKRVQEESNIAVDILPMPIPPAKKN